MTANPLSGLVHRAEKFIPMACGHCDREADKRTVLDRFRPRTRWGQDGRGCFRMLRHSSNAGSGNCTFNCNWQVM